MWPLSIYMSLRIFFRIVKKAGKEAVVGINKK